MDIQERGLYLAYESSQARMERIVKLLSIVTSVALLTVLISLIKAR